MLIKQQNKSLNANEAHSSRNGCQLVKQASAECREQTATTILRKKGVRCDQKDRHQASKVKLRQGLKRLTQFKL